MTGYQDYFKKRRRLSEKAPPRRRARHSWWLVIVATVLGAGSTWYLFGGEQQVPDIFSKLEISLFGAAVAEDSEAKSSSPKTKVEEKPSTDTPPQVPTQKGAAKNWTEEEVTLFTKLDARKKELDQKETELGKLEEELQRQREEIEQRLSRLEDVRSKISSKLEDKVKVDAQKVETLVSVYANMKPAQAAKVIEGINEDLAVEVLTKMKNKNAAEILNLMDAEKAKKLSERFAGFREPASASR